MRFMGNSHAKYSAKDSKNMAMIVTPRKQKGTRFYEIKHIGGFNADPYAFYMLGAVFQR